MVVNYYLTLSSNVFYITKERLNSVSEQVAFDAKRVPDSRGLSFPCDFTVSSDSELALSLGEWWDACQGKNGERYFLMASDTVI